MSNQAMPWFRMYTDFLNDPKIIALAFEDQRHFIGILALKSDGLIDQDCDENLKNRIVAQRLWIDHAIVLDVKKRLINSGLIDSDWQPLGWNKRQFKSDKDVTGAERQKRYREKNSNALRNESVTLTDTDTDTDTDTEKVKSVCAKPAPPTVKPKKEKVGLSVDDLVAKGVERQTAVDWFVVRRDKRSSTLTVTALQAVEAQALEAGLSLDAAVRACVEAGWVGFKASWWRNRESGGGLGKTGLAANKAQSVEDANNRLMREMEEKYA